MSNEEFLERFNNAHGIFLPYIISDHSPALLVLPDVIQVKSKSFRFFNYVADKEEFLDVVKEGWKNDVQGCKMYQVTQKLKLLKKPLKKLNWKNGNLFEKVESLKMKLEDAQKDWMLILIVW